MCLTSYRPTTAQVLSLMGDPDREVVCQTFYPSPDVAEFGAHIARLADHAEGAGHETRPRCQTCAFRRGTLANRTAATLAMAAECVATGEPFYCHEGLEDGVEPTTACAGWAAARREIAAEQQGVSCG